ncbi:hypothetical protein [Streptomyces sp. SM11]|uniref:hypothetical protein n=1 Tax=Streptomyces sp. SM11 TaxID=565557 RepID=UPI0035BBF14D
MPAPPLLHTVLAPLQLKLCRLLRGSTAHWLTPSRALEADLPAADVERYATTTAPLTPEAVRTASANSWRPRRRTAGAPGCRRGCTRRSRGHCRRPSDLSRYRA